MPARVEAARASKLEAGVTYIVAGERNEPCDMDQRQGCSRTVIAACGTFEAP